MTTVAAPRRAPKAALDAWNRALADPCLRDLPFKVETTATGQYILSPAKPPHSKLQYAIAALLDRLAPDSHLSPGKPATEVAVETSGGIKAVDVAWISDEIDRQLPDGAPAYVDMPELMIEVLSASNTTAEIDEKRDLYFEGGALEIWICDQQRRMHFHGTRGPLDQSALVPAFPTRMPKP